MCDCVIVFEVLLVFYISWSVAIIELYRFRIVIRKIDLS